MVYLFIILLTLWGYYRFDLRVSSDKAKELFFAFEFVVLVLVVALRYRVGGDSLSYEDDYATMNGLEELRSYSFATSGAGFLWYAFIAFCQSISKKWLVLQIIHAIIFNFATFRFIKKHCGTPFLAVFFYSIFNYLYFNTEILRASLAVAIFLLWGYDALLKKKWLLYVLLAFVSSNFHIESVALFFFPIAFLLGRRQVNGVRLAIVLVVALFVLNVFQFDRFLYSFARFSEAIEYRAGLYSVEVDNNFNGLLAKIIVLIPVFLCLWGTKFIPHDSKQLVVVRGLMVLYAAISVMTLYYPAFFSRMIDALRILYVITIADILGVLFRRNQRVLYILVLIVAIFCGGFMQYRDSLINIKYYPYHSVLNPQVEPKREMLFTK